MSDYEDRLAEVLEHEEWVSRLLVAELEEREQWRAVKASVGAAVGAWWSAVAPLLSEFGQAGARIAAEALVGYVAAELETRRRSA